MTELHNKPDHPDSNPPGGSHDLDRMEDEFYVLCAAIRRECDESMRREEGHENDNFSACQRATGRYDAEAVPAFDAIVRIAGQDSPACRRARERAASCLHGLALNHVWAGRNDIAEILTQRAKELAPEGSLVLSRIEDTVFSPASVAHGVKKVSTEEHADEHADDHAHSHEVSHSGKGYGVWIAAAVGLVIGIFVVVFTGKAPKVATAPAPLHAPEKQAVAPPAHEAVVAKPVAESVTQAAPPSAQELHLKHPEEKTKPRHTEAPKTEPSARSAAAPEKVSPAPAKAAPVVAKAKETRKKVAEATPKPREARPVEAKKTPVTAKESRAVTLGTLLSRLETKLNNILKELANKESQIASRRSTLELYAQQKGADSADYRKVGEEYNRLIRDYNRQLAEANKVAAEHETLLKEYRQLVGAQHK